MRARAAQTALTASACAAAALLAAVPSAAQPAAPPTEPEGTPGVTAERILFGQSAAFSGPAAELGRGMRLGIQAAFKEANDAGGVHGRRLELVTVDDGYEPEAAITNTRRLIEDEGVFALVGGVGTPTSRSAVPVAEEAGVPYIAPFTGAGFLRNEPHVINLRASYAQETEEMVERLTRDLGIERIAVVIQNDSFGRAGLAGVRAAFDRRGMEAVAIGVYPRNTTAVKTALVDIELGRPEAVIIVGAYQPVASLIAWARHTGLDPVFMTLSFVGSNALAEELGPRGAGVYVTQVVPFPSARNSRVATAYRRALRAHTPGAEPGFVSFEGYLAGRLVIEALERCGTMVDRDRFIEVLRSAGSIDLNGFRLVFGDGDNQGSDAVFLTVIDERGRYRPATRLEAAVSE
ncbi:MAG: ABC transporter substrate-binding protein [Holophagales bacterium]|nr:ABC transporter substrate-binding protein [Holophagales bacterium]MYG29008.1 ABC transporter substrate-binding protein [Holophagales bacterium]MYI80672.1 ABC transporter substrate-binding protein [Holophagales bacterium]